MIPADVRVLELKTVTLKVEQPILTGEVNPVSKYTDAIDTENAIIADKSNMLFSGTLVANGSTIGVVTATGMKTEIGKIQ